MDSAEYQLVFAQSTRFHGGGFLVLVRANTLLRARLGLAIAKRACPRASERNRLKRIVRESFRTHYDRLPSVDVVVLASKGVADKPNSILSGELARTWLKIGRRPWAA